MRPGQLQAPFGWKMRGQRVVWIGTRSSLGGGTQGVFRAGGAGWLVPASELRM